MASIQFKGNPLHTVGDLPQVGSTLAEFKLTKTDLSEVSAQDFSGKNIILNIFPSIDTPTCATSVRKFNERAAALPNTVVLCVSADLPFAQKRFCGAEGINNVTPVSSFRHAEFGKQLGVTLSDGPLAGLLARSVVVVNKDGKVLHTQLVNELSEEPNYEAAIKALS